MRRKKSEETFLLLDVGYHLYLLLNKKKINGSQFFSTQKCIRYGWVKIEIL